MTKGIIIAGDFSKIIAREKKGRKFEIGEILVAEKASEKILLQVFDLSFGSQISQQNRELISGMKLEENLDAEFMDPHIRNYTLAFMKNILTVSKKQLQTPKTLPEFFSTVREIKSEDIDFLPQPEDLLPLGKLRSGSKVVDVDVSLPGRKVFSHHILIQGTTGRGKSVLVKNLLWNSIDQDYCGILVLDPHDEYYGRNSLGLKEHPSKNRVVYYTPGDAPSGTNSLKINLKCIKPSHFNGVINWSDPQSQLLSAYYKEYKDNWIEAAVLEKDLQTNFGDGTISVVKRRLMAMLNISVRNDEIKSEGVFDTAAGETTIDEITNQLTESKTVIIDTSSLPGNVEILIGTLITTEIFSRYKKYKSAGKLENKPVISVVLEEAPRVLGKEVLEKGTNIFSTIAREGRKFKVGLTAITQLPSLIPRQVLANMNTKIILGTEMKPERQAIIESAAQDLSDDDRNIASLDIGEALVTSNFAKFAIPIKIPFFDKIAKAAKETEIQTDFSGISL